VSNRYAKPTRTQDKKIETQTCETDTFTCENATFKCENDTFTCEIHTHVCRFFNIILLIHVIFQNTRSSAISTRTIVIYRRRGRV
jgi:hypothetical protein